MFKNIGSKIQTLAEAVCWIGIIASVIIGLALILLAESEFSVIYGLFIIILGSVFSWIGSFITYGFGKLIENSDIIVANMNNNQLETQTAPSHTANTNEKIESLKKLKEQDLITEEEYNQKMGQLK